MIKGGLYCLELTPEELKMEERGNRRERERRKNRKGCMKRINEKRDTERNTKGWIGW